MKLYVTVIVILLVTIINAQEDKPPVVTAIGNQSFCPKESIHVVTDFSITDVDDTSIDSFFIQISSGYQRGLDVLTLQGDYPGITSQWDENEGKLRLTSATSTEILLTLLEQAVRDVVFTTRTTNYSVERTFSFTIGDANYLPLTDHFYEFVNSPSILWTQARAEAETRTYFGRKGYLATLTSQEEANFAGKQASGSGWIGASDIENEGEWKWVTGPEAGTVFWNGTNTVGSVVNGLFAFWNTDEPNNFIKINPNGEHYAHITDPLIGVVGAWNDLPDEGGSGLYVPKGYIVEYGVPSDPPLSIVATTKIYTPEVDTVKVAEICFPGKVSITASGNESGGVIKWYDALIGGNEVGEGSLLTIDVEETKSFYASVSINNCNKTPRKEVTVIVHKPEIISTTNDVICFGKANLRATSNIGTVHWYDAPNGGNLLAIGENFETPEITTTTLFYVEAIFKGCSSITNKPRTKVIAELNTILPEFDVVDELILCRNIGSTIIETANRRNIARFNWSKDGELLEGEINETLEIMLSGVYKVKAFSAAGCESATKTIVVRDSDIAEITNQKVLVTEDVTNNSVEVITNLLGDGDYEFSLDDISYQDVPRFENLEPNFYNLFIKDKNGCGTSVYQFSILNFNSFFTPNGDGINDTWKITGVDQSFYPTLQIEIFDRFGKLVFKSKNEHLEWNGTFNGKTLPEDDYWYKVLLIDANEKRIQKTGNFSLILK